MDICSIIFIEKYNCAVFYKLMVYKALVIAKEKFQCLRINTPFTVYPYSGEKPAFKEVITYWQYMKDHTALLMKTQAF